MLRDLPLLLLLPCPLQQLSVHLLLLILLLLCLRPAAVAISSAGAARPAAARQPPRGGRGRRAQVFFKPSRQLPAGVPGLPLLFAHLLHVRVAPV